MEAGTGFCYPLPVPKFLFWNLNQRDIPDLIGRLARAELVDVLILAECGSTPARLLEALNAESTEYDFGFSSCHRLRVFTRFDAGMMPAVLETDRITIRQLKLPGRRPLLVAGVHLPSKINLSEESQVFESVYLARVIDEVEKKEKHRFTMVMGDLNMNPFEAGVVGARGGLHAVASRRVAQRSLRKVQREDYRFFYNPMWSHLGDRNDAGGTYYYDGSEAVCYFWNMYDQVLLRPALTFGFAPEQVRILTEAGGVPLLARGRPNKTVASDHLPVMVELEF